MNPFCCDLKQALNNKEFMPGGGVLGFVVILASGHCYQDVRNGEKVMNLASKCFIRTKNVTNHAH